VEGIFQCIKDSTKTLYVGKPPIFFGENECENYKVLACVQTQNWWGGDNPKNPFFEAEKW